MSTFVSLGNALQPFARLLEGIGRLATQLPQPVIVQHGHTPFRDGACLPVPFLGMNEFIEHIHSADLLIMHAGAGSLIHAIGAGKVPVVMPRRAVFGEHVNDHQVDLARALAAEGKVVVANGPEDLMRAVEEATTRQAEWQKNAREVSTVPALVSTIGQILREHAVRFPT